MLYCLMENKFIHVPNMLYLSVCVTFLTNISNFPKWSCVLICCSECPICFVPDVEINCEEDVNIPFIWSCHYTNMISFYFH